MPFDPFKDLSLLYDTVKKFESTNFDAIARSSSLLEAHALVEANRPNLSVLESAVARLQLDARTSPLQQANAVMAAQNRQFSALESFVDRLQLSAKAVQNFIESTEAARKLADGSRVVDAWRSMLDKSSALLNPDAINNAMASLRLSPQFSGFPQFDISTVEPSRRPTVKAGVDRIVKSVRSVATKPTVSGQDVEDLLVEIQGISTASSEDSRYLKPFQIGLILWLLDLFAQDPMKQATFNVLTYLLLFVAGLSPVQLPSAHSPQVASLFSANHESWQLAGLPEPIRKAGPAAEASALRFMNDEVRNRNTRQAYVRAIVQFMNWCQDRQLALVDITELSVSAFVQERTNESSPATARQQLAAIRRLFDRFVADGILPSNPASRVRAPQSATVETPKPQLEPILVRQLIDSIDITQASGIRDAALLNLMVYGFAPASAIVSMDIGNYFFADGSHWLRLKNRNGEFYVIPAHRRISDSINAYLQMLAATNDAHYPLWRSVTRLGGIGPRRLSRIDLFRMTQRRASDAGLPGRVSPRTLRSVGITAFLANGGSLQSARALTSQQTLAMGATAEVSHADIERVAI